MEAKLHMLSVALLHLSTLPQDDAKPKAAAAPGPLRVGRFAEHHPRESSRGDRTASGPVLDVHPVDAAARGVADGDLVRVFNDRGSLELPATVVDRVQPGLGAVPFGWWGRGVNALTNPAVGRAIGSAAFHDTLVQVERLAGGPGMPDRRAQENA